jgi:hypothetical protein
MKQVVLPLLGAGLSPESVFVQLRGMYEADVSDREIRDIIAWAVSKDPEPCGYRSKVRNYSAPNFHPLTKPGRVTADQAIANAEKWLGDFRCDECDLWHVSPWRPLEDCRADALMLLAALYSKEEYINIVTDFTLEQRDGGTRPIQKAPAKLSCGISGCARFVIAARRRATPVPGFALIQ